jgi:hypothetical protein
MTEQDAGYSFVIRREADLVAKLNGQYVLSGAALHGLTEE